MSGEIQTVRIRNGAFPAAAYGDGSNVWRLATASASVFVIGFLGLIIRNCSVCKIVDFCVFLTGIISHFPSAGVMVGFGEAVGFTAVVFVGEGGVTEFAEAGTDGAADGHVPIVEDNAEEINEELPDVFSESL